MTQDLKNVIKVQKNPDFYKLNNWFKLGTSLIINPF